MKKMLTQSLISVLFLTLSSVSYALDNAVETENKATSDNIRRAIITNAIENREPVSDLTGTTVTTNLNKVYLFTEVIGKANTMITHRWFLDGKLEAEVILKIGSNRWRTYSSKTLYSPNHLGNWYVEVVDENNKPISSVNFSYAE